MELTVEQALQQGVIAHNSGNLQEAEQVYRAILQSEPLHPYANRQKWQLILKSRLKNNLVFY